jgi:hypothetical protein
MARWHNSAPCLQFHERMFVVRAEHCVLRVDGERSQTQYVLVVPERPRQITDKEMHHTHMCLVRKAVRRGLDSVR